MNQREKILAASVGGIVLLGVVIFGLKAVIVNPLKTIDAQNTILREKLDKIKAERRAYFAAEDTLMGFTQRTFSDEVDEASARSGALLTSQLAKSGLQETDFSRLPVGPRKISGASEVGWSVQGDGKLDNVINLLFLLEKSRYLHRIDGLTLSPGDAPGLVKVRFLYLTLVMTPAPVVTPIDLKTNVPLDGVERALYGLIVQRDILRPFIPPATPVVVPGPPNRPNPAIPGPETLQVVSLSEWKGQPEIHVRDVAQQKTLRYRTGDTLAGGVIVMIDYRPLPRPGRQTLQSYSRVIIKVGKEFWAIERGQTLAEKYRLTPEQLPERLSKL